MEILEEQYDYYQKLYASDSIAEDHIKTYLRDTDNLNILNEQESKQLEGEITEYECKLTIEKMKLNKSPGSDGIPVEFYQTFWDNIRTIFTDSMNSAYKNGELSVSQRRGILSLIFKKNDRTLLANWRPISLLNTDYKILAHILANRLKNVIGKLIHTDQSGYIKGRNINYNIRLIQDVIDYFEEGEQEGAILFLDFHKAFDTVSHEFLNSVLSKYNFGSSFKQWVKVLYENADSCVTNNGWTSKPFPLKKGIRQGCPLSALLFLLVVEVLAANIRKDKNNGINIKIKGENKLIQISQLADDTTLFFNNEEAIMNGLNIVEKFGKVSGLKLNKEKTEGLWLGTGENRKDLLAGVNWDKNSVKALGVHFGYDKKDIETKNWSEKIISIKNCLKCWNSRDLSLQGRIQVIKTIALAKVVYLVSAICVPNSVINEINKEFFAFIWHYRRDKIARKVLVNDIENGGLNMIDFRTFCIATKAVWAARLYHCKNETWGIIPSKYFENCEIEKMLCMNIESEKHIPVQIPSFYKEVIKSWHLCGGGKTAPQGANDIRKEIIWGNKFIQAKGKTLFFKSWKESNINFIDDIINNGGLFKSGEEIYRKLNNKTNWLIEYKTILKSIPKAWKEKLQTCNANDKVKKEFKPYINLSNRPIYDLPFKAREYYSILINKIRKRSFIENYWSNLFPDRPIWTKIYETRIKNQKIKKIADFHFKLLHQVLPSQEKLHRWKISNTDTCRFGCTINETYNHLFITCPRLLSLRIFIEDILKQLGYDIKLSYKILIFGYKITYTAYEQINALLSHIFYAIYKYWINNNSNILVKHWLFCELKHWQDVYYHMKDSFELLNKFICKWLELNTQPT